MRVSDGVTPGGIAVAGVSTISGGPIQQSLVPDADATYDLGSPTNQWRDLYLTNASMYLGETKVAASNNQLTVDDEPVALGSEVAEEANQRLIVNTDRRIYGEYAPPKVNPNSNLGGWYYRTSGGSVLRWNFTHPNQILKVLPVNLVV